MSITEPLNRLNGASVPITPGAPNKSSFVSEHEQFSIAAAKAARQIMEELGTSCPGTTENDDSEVHGGGTPYETIDDVNAAMTLGDSLSRTPWGMNAKDNRSYYISGTGHTVTVKPADEENPNKASVKKVEKYLKSWMEENDWQIRQSEVSQRLDRHGEVFDMLYYEDDDDPILRVSFAEPFDLSEDADSKYHDIDDSEKEFYDDLGVRRTNNIQFQPVAYFIDEVWYPDLRRMSRMNLLPDLDNSVDRIFVQHRKRNVLGSDQRGLNLYWPVREELTWAKRLLANMMRVSSFQAAFGAIRTINAAHGADAVRAHLASVQAGTAGGVPEQYDFPSPSVVTSPSSVNWVFPETGKGLINHIEVLVQLLRACSSGMKLPEFMLTANVSEGNFASTLVSEGPFHKSMGFEQNLMVTEDTRILYQALRYAASRNVDGLTDADIDNIVLHTEPPRVQTRNRKEDFEIRNTLYKEGLVSGKSLDGSEGHDFNREQAQIALERSVVKPPVTETPSPGPVAGINADPMKEKGVMDGEPDANPTANP